MSRVASDYYTRPIVATMTSAHGTKLSITIHKLFHALDLPYRGLVDDGAAYDSQFEKSAVEQCPAFLQDVAGVNAVSMVDRH